MRYKDVKKISIMALLGNLFLLIIKAIIGAITLSESMIADAVNSLGDIFSSLASFIGNKVASKKPDTDHNLGHGKAEYIYSMIISMIMIAVSLATMVSSISAFISKKEYDFNIFLIVVCITTIVVKLLLYLITKKYSQKHKNLLIKSMAKDHRNDILLTSLNLISAIFAFYNIYYLDGVMGLIIAVYILLGAVEIFKESYDILMDKSLDESVKSKIIEITKNYPDIKKIQHFNSTPIGYKYQISVTIFVNGKMSTFDSHKIADDLEKEIIEKIEEVDLAIIHVNPLDTKCVKKSKKVKKV